ncbi:Zinc carboxypeptidase [Halobacillus karajensis]|uniref:M14 family zinc carboxypeptidase n=1 Tax=Halobacillus karajensis TaxID=195088 RepID=UPI0008A7F5CA|nr:M14 family zinc carboxypeptidase [Halobacillus karajensis]SEI02495.1 Zinc carboxypeptidase [Halobacillus karajensis]
MKKLVTIALTGTVLAGGVFADIPLVQAAGNGPDYQGHETINTSILHTYSEMVDFLKTQEKKQSNMELEVIGETVKGRDIHLVKYMQNPANPTILYITQQHGDEALTTEGSLDFIKQLGTGKSKGLFDDVNILIIPMYNADGAMGDVNYELENYAASGDRHLTRLNAKGIDLNRDHDAKTQPETQALHNNVLEKYDIDYMIDLHHQGAQWVKDGKYVSGAIFPSHPDHTDPEVLQGSKQLGAVVYDAIEPKGWGHLANYAGKGSAYDNGISVYGLAHDYDISTLLLEIRGTADNANDFEVLGQKSNGYLTKQAVIAMDATARAIADGTINEKEVSFWDDLPVQEERPYR